MDNTSKNALDMIDSLTMQYNCGRQAAITNELVNIITGSSFIFGLLELMLMILSQVPACSKCQGYATAFIEGRIAIEYFDPSEASQAKKYAFKYLPKTAWTMCGPSILSVWDFKIKKQLRQYPKYTNPILSVVFNRDGGKMAVAMCFTWDEGEQEAKWEGRMKGVGGKEREMPMVWIRKFDKLSSIISSTSREPKYEYSVGFSV
ncbi:mitotic spindle checkpoint protein Bub3 [Marasmius sp. AFHP31]|nr:mitotic spindle checkpoint protein Bub3 [Marasmius sp. AFHP31]